MHSSRIYRRILLPTLPGPPSSTVGHKYFVLLLPQLGQKVLLLNLPVRVPTRDIGTLQIGSGIQYYHRELQRQRSKSSQHNEWISAFLKTKYFPLHT
jgi:hypothetical protein